MVDVEVVTARLDDPEGATCGHCGKENDFADDCGWFYFEGACGCRACWEGPIGTEHVRKHGLGER